MRYRRIIIKVGGDTRVEYAIHAKADENWRPIAGTEERIEVDTVCIGYGFFPSIELLRLAGCTFTYSENLGGPTVIADKWGRSTIENIFVAGDGTGVEGVYVAIAMGEIAALRIARDLGLISETQVCELAKTRFRRIDHKRKFQRALLHMYKVGDGIYGLADEETIVCRCESVSRAQIDEAVESTSDVSVVKAYTRAGMGLCQGRNCHRQISALIARRHGMQIMDVPLATARFPVKPVSLGAVADDRIQDEKYFIDA